jgi:diguanylate cyclase (GGDEF)-like protein
MPHRFARQFQLRIAAAALVVLLPFGAALYFAWGGVAAEDASRALLVEALELTNAALDAKFLAAEFDGQQMAYAFDIVRGVPGAAGEDSEGRRRFRDSSKALGVKLDAVARFPLTPDEQRHLRAAREAFEAFLRLDAQVIATYRRGTEEDIRRASALVFSGEHSLPRVLSDHIARLAESAVARGRLASDEARAAQARARRLFVASGLAALALALVSALLLARALRRQGELLTRIEDLARTDALTGIANRRVWEETLPLELARAGRTAQPLAAALLDLDHFKAYNDRHGHQAGDRLLQTFAAALRAKLRKTDVVARYGGEEFGVILPNCGPGEARALVDRLRDRLPDGQTFSAGVACWDSAESADALIARADLALYEAKQAGRNRTVVSTPASPSPDFQAAPV